MKKEKTTIYKEQIKLLKEYLRARTDQERKELSRIIKKRGEVIACC